MPKKRECKGVSIPKIKELPSGNYFCQLRIKQPDGKTKSISITEESYALCQAKALAIKTGFIADEKKHSSITLAAAANKYIDSRRNVLSPSTIRGYTQIVNNRFSAAMCRRIDENIPWQKIINAEARNVAPKTLKNSFMFICSVLAENSIEKPKVTLPQVPPAERPWLTPEEILVFIDAIRGRSFEIPALLALHSLRRSEIAALQWESICNGIITVSGSAVYDENNKLTYKKANKNTSSTRKIPIMIPRLAELTAEGGTGKVMKSVPNTLYEQINSVCEQAGLPKVGVHGLRHSFASLAMHCGLSELECMRIGGWQNNSTMRKIYTHISDSDVRRAENKMAEFFKNSI